MHIIVISFTVPCLFKIRYTYCKDCLLCEWYMGHSMSNQQGILGHLSDFPETWCVVILAYGTHHAPIPIFGYIHKYFEFMTTIL